MGFKQCVKSVYGKLHYATHKEDYINRNRSYREHNREWLNSIKSQLKCSICGEYGVSITLIQVRKREVYLT